MLEQVAIHLREKTDELLKKLLSYAGIEITELDLRNMDEFKDRLEKDGYELVTWTTFDRTYYKLTQYGIGMIQLELWTEFDISKENKAKFMYKFSPL